MEWKEYKYNSYLYLISLIIIITGTVFFYDPVWLGIILLFCICGTLTQINLTKQGGKK